MLSDISGITNDCVNGHPLLRTIHYNERNSERESVTTNKNRSLDGRTNNKTKTGRKPDGQPLERTIRYNELFFVNPTGSL